MTFGPNVKGIQSDSEIEVQHYVSATDNGAPIYFNHNAPIGAWAGAGGSQFQIGAIGIDASRASSVYTDNGHVYPLSCALNFIIKC